MLLGKPKDKFEVYNDLDDELVNLFRCVQDRPAEFLLELGMLPLNSRSLGNGSNSTQAEGILPSFFPRRM